MKKPCLIVLIIAVTLFAFTGCAKPTSQAAKTTPQSDVSSAPSSAVSLPSASSSASSAASAVSSAPSSPSSEPAVASSSAKQADTVSVAIDGTKGGGKTYNFTVGLQDNDTVLTVLLRACGKSNVYYTGSASAAFVTTLYGISYGQQTPQSGWLYSVNGVIPDYSCGKYNTLKPGDQIYWRFSLTGK